MRFTDPAEAGRALAQEVSARRGLELDLEGALVLAVARGGVAVAAEVAKHLGAPLDVILVRRLLVPRGPEEPVCAVSVAGALVLDEEVAARRDAPDKDPALEAFLTDVLGEFDARARACRGARTPLDLSGRNVLVVDNGVRTGSTMRAALRALRTRRPSRVVAAFPVASVEGRASIAQFADEVVCLATPEPFGHVGLWYASFKRQDDEEIAAALDDEGLASFNPPTSSAL